MVLGRYPILEYLDPYRLHRASITGRVCTKAFYQEALGPTASASGPIILRNLN